MKCVQLYNECMGLCGAIYGDVGRVEMVVCQDVVPKAPPNDRVRAKGPNEKPSAGARMKRA